MTCRVQNPDIPRASRVEEHDEMVGRDRKRLFANRTVRLEKNPSSHSLKHRRHVLNVSPEARTSEILCKPMEEQNPRLTTGPSPVDQR